MTSEQKQQRIYTLIAEIRGIDLTKKYYEKYLNDYVQFKDEISSFVTTLNSAKDCIDSAGNNYQNGGFIADNGILGLNLIPSISEELSEIANIAPTIIATCSGKIEEYKTKIAGFNYSISLKQSELNSLRY